MTVQPVKKTPKERFFVFWKDPVWSKVIAAVILALPVYFGLEKLREPLLNSELTITSHNSSTPVGREIQLRGTFKNINTRKEEVFAFVWAPTEEKYYWSKAALFDSDQSWEVSHFIVGEQSPKNENEHYEIGISLVENESFKKVSSGPTNEIPRGVKVLQRIKVARK